MEGNSFINDQQILKNKGTHEGEGTFDNVMDYLKLNKNIVIPAAEFPKELSSPKDYIGKMWLSEYFIYCFDKEGNTIEINRPELYKIKSLQGLDRDQRLIKAKEELKEKGFNVFLHGDREWDKCEMISYHIKKFKGKVSEQKSQDEKQNFDY